MNENQDILENLRQAGQPFKVPEGYFESFDDRLMARIAAEESETPQEKRTVWRILKPALALAATFAIIFGMGYGVLALTHTLDRGTSSVAAEGYASAEEELIRPVSLINYYQSEPVEENTELDEETLVDYLSSSLSWADLADIYAQSY